MKKYFKNLLRIALCACLVMNITTSASALTPRKNISDVLIRSDAASYSSGYFKASLNTTGTSLNVYGNNPTAGNNVNVWLYTTDNSNSMYWILLNGPATSDWYVATKLNTNYTLNLNTLSSNRNCDIYKLESNVPADAVVRIMDAGIYKDSSGNSCECNYIYLRHHGYYLTSETLSTSSSGYKSGNAYWSPTAYNSLSKWVL